MAENLTERPKSHLHDASPVSQHGWEAGKPSGNVAESGDGIAEKRPAKRLHVSLFDVPNLASFAWCSYVAFGKSGRGSELMTLHGRVENGVVVIQNAALPDGTLVEVTPLPCEAATRWR